MPARAVAERNDPQRAADIVAPVERAAVEQSENPVQRPDEAGGRIRDPAHRLRPGNVPDRAGDEVRQHGARRPALAAAHHEPPAGVADLALLARIETVDRSEEHTSELQSLMRTSYPVFCLK